MSATLFLVFMNDLLEENFKGTVNAFADDVAFLFASKDSLALWNDINDSLKTLRNWCSKSKMIVNVAKTKFIYFGLNNQNGICELHFHGINCNRIENCDCQIIGRVNHIKYLGITIDEKLTWHQHINGVMRNARSKFYYLRNICDTRLLRSLYYALIDSKIHYGLHCWGGTFKKSIQRVRVTQNYFLKIILHKNKHDSSFPLYEELKILPVQHLFFFKVLQIFFNRRGNSNTDKLHHEHNTRSGTANLIRKPKINKSIMQRSLTYIGPKICNEMQ